MVRMKSAQDVILFAREVTGVQSSTQMDPFHKPYTFHAISGQALCCHSPHNYVDEIPHCIVIRWTILLEQSYIELAGISGVKRQCNARPSGRTC